MFIQAEKGFLTYQQNKNFQPIHYDKSTKKISYLFYKALYTPPCIDSSLPLTKFEEPSYVL